jgi:hypothetical protein
MAIKAYGMKMYMTLNHRDEEDSHPVAAVIGSSNLSVRKS